MEAEKQHCPACATPTDSDKWMYTLMTTLLFLIIVNPYTCLLYTSPSPRD